MLSNLEEPKPNPEKNKEKKKTQNLEEATIIVTFTCAHCSLIYIYSTWQTYPEQLTEVKVTFYIHTTEEVGG